MGRYADNWIMDSAFVSFNKMLKYFERNLDSDSFDLDNFTHGNFGISESRFYWYLKMLVDGGYVGGVTLRDNGEKDEFDGDDYERFHADFDKPCITVKGLQFLAENTAWVKALKAVRSLNEFKSLLTV